MKVSIRQNNILVFDFYGRLANHFMDSMNNAIHKVKKSTTSKADAVFKVNYDSLWEMPGNNGTRLVYLWAEDTTISVFLNENAPYERK